MELQMETPETTTARSLSIPRRQQRRDRVRAGSHEEVKAVGRVESSRCAPSPPSHSPYTHHTTPTSAGSDMQSETSTLTLRPHLPIAHDSDLPKSPDPDTPTSDEFIFSTKRRHARLSMDFRPVEPVSRKQEMQRSFRLVSTIGFTSLVTGT
ncbi:hypothetical protein CERZMDRAFT_100938 [Cercospora zeae-maydis SCOH1-5]|uniref:Uncharacterized protein n=1 Tax=Cercospora zeae-maydis SCOH1-5 TaxID=717836 RepID=A0A6A6F6X1_9PEZI|nr:hypothetical protein CERZMDRAFT_100938 [Cercospora zeae-maydis SCOH1-5]